MTTTRSNYDADRAACVRWTALSLCTICAIVAIGVLGASFKKVSSTEYGLKYNVHKKQLDDAAKTGGLYPGPPGFHFIKFPSTFITADLPSGVCVSRDGLRVQYQVRFQYQITEANIKSTILRYRDFDGWANVVEAAGESAVQHSCSEFIISNFQNQRGVIQSTMFEKVKTELEPINALAVSLQLSNVELPSAYANAVAHKQAAAEDIELAVNQRTQELTKARTELLRATEQARQIQDKAANDANVTLTEALLEAEETMYILQKEAEVLIEARKSFNLTTDGLLTYKLIRTLASVPELHVTAGEPAQISRKEDL